MTLSSSGRHRDQVPSPDPRRAASSSDPGDPAGPHSARHEGEPLLRLVRGEPSAEELAALTVVVATLSQPRSRRRPTPVGAWASYADAHRRPMQPGPGGWRAAGRFA
ncbi:MAG TPA: acyl-CoA carboxylase subunit epsilon [Blastococcus sp.]